MSDVFYIEDNTHRTVIKILKNTILDGVQSRSNIKHDKETKKKIVNFLYEKALDEIKEKTAQANTIKELLDLKHQHNQYLEYYNSAMRDPDERVFKYSLDQFIEDFAK